MKVEIKTTIELPKVPDFLINEAGQPLPLSAFTTQALREIGRSWAEELLEKARKQRVSGPDSTKNLFIVPDSKEHRRTVSKP